MPADLSPISQPHRGLLWTEGDYSYESTFFKQSATILRKMVEENGAVTFASETPFK